MAQACKQARPQESQDAGAKTQNEGGRSEDGRSPLTQVEAGADGVPTGGSHPHGVANKRRRALTPSVTFLRRLAGHMGPPTAARQQPRPGSQVVLRCQPRGCPQRWTSAAGGWGRSGQTTHQRAHTCSHKWRARVRPARVAAGPHSCQGRPLAPWHEWEPAPLDHSPWSVVHGVAAAHGMAATHKVAVACGVAATHGLAAADRRNPWDIPPPMSPEPTGSPGPMRPRHPTGRRKQ